MSKFYKYYLLIIIFNIFSSLLLNNNDEFNYLEKDILIQKKLNNTVQTFFLNCANKNKHYLSILPLNKTYITIQIHNESQNKNKLFTTELDCSKGKIELNLSSENESYVEIYFVENNGLNKYKIIDEDDDDKEIGVKKMNNFVRFLDDEEDITVDIRFKKKIKKEDKTHLYCRLVRLPFNDEDIDKNEDLIYIIPKANLFNDYLNNKTIQYMNFSGKEESFEFNNIIYEKNEVKPYFALVFSIVSTNVNEKYYVTINKDKMSIFLIISIALALVFAILTFF